MSSVLITGASRGIGRAIAIELSARGHRVIATARRPETLADLPVDQRLRLDVTSGESVDAAIREAGDIDVLVSNAGETVRAPLAAFQGIDPSKLTAVRLKFDRTAMSVICISGIGFGQEEQ